MMKTLPFKNIDEYIKLWPKDVQVLLMQLRKTIKAAAPMAEETISYQMPAFQYHGKLVFFAAYEKHIGFYPTASPVEAFAKEISKYKNSKGTVQFPLDKPLPLALITKMVKYKLKENIAKAALKKSIKSIVKKAAPKKTTDDDLVKDYLNKLEPAAKADIDAVRKIIKSASPKLNERIKWNAPSYYYKDDIVTFGPYKTHKLLLVFHHRAIVKIKSTLLEGDYKDRRLVHFKDKVDATKNKKELTRIITELIKVIDKK